MTEPLLPEQTGDDSDLGWGDDRWYDRDERERHDDERLRDEVPPHHVAQD